MKMFTVIDLFIWLKQIAVKNAGKCAKVCITVKTFAYERVSSNVNAHAFVHQWQKKKSKIIQHV